METTTDTRALLAAARRQAWIVLLTIVAAVAAGYAVSQSLPERYETKSSLFLNGLLAPEETGGLDTAAIAQSLSGSYARVAESRAVAVTAARAAGVPPGQAIGSIEASSAPDSQILTLAASGSSPRATAALTNAAAQALVDRVRELAGSSAAVELEIIDRAPLPSAPAAPRTDLILLFAGLAGLTAGLALAALRERLDDRLHGPRAAERALGLPVLATVPRLGRRARRATARERDPHGNLAEAHRVLASALGRLAEQEGSRRILLTSAREHDGNATVSAHLALALAEDRVRTAVIEVDLRHPSLRRELEANGAPPLEEALGSINGGLPQEAAIAEHLTVLAPASPTGDGSGLLRSPELARALEAARAESDIVVIEGPPTLGRSDVAVLARHIDAAVLVAADGRTRSEDLRVARAELERTGVKVAGAVVTGVR